MQNLILFQRRKSLSDHIYNYGTALVLTLAALVCTAVLWSHVHTTPFIFMIAAVVLSAWRGGLGPGLLAAATGILTLDYYLITPRYAIFNNSSDLFQFSVFALVALLISWLEESRRQSESLYRSLKEELEVILNTAADGITAQGSDGQGVFANPAAARILWGETPEHVVKTPIGELRKKVELLYEDGSPMPFSAMPRAKVFATGQPADMTFGNRRKDTGEIRWISLKSAPVFDEHGKVRLAVNVFSDVTESRRIETIRQESQQRLRKVLDNLAAFVGMMDLNGVVIEANRTSVESTGLQPEEIIGKPFDQTYWWSHSEEVRQQLRAAIQRAAAGETVRYDVEALVKGQERIMVDFMIAPVFDDKGQVQYLIPSGIDVTERTRLAALLAQQRTHLENILNNVPGVVYEIEGDPQTNDRHVTFVSDYAEHMLGYPMDKWRSHPNFWSEIIISDDWQRSVDEANRIRNTLGQTATVQFRCRAYDGRIVEAESYSTTLYDSHGNRIGSCGVVMDITERKKAEEELRRLNALTEDQRNRLNNIIADVPGVIYESTITVETGVQMMDYISGYVRTMLGYSPEDWENDLDLWNKIIYPEDQQMLGEQITAIYNSGQPGAVQVRFIRKDGNIIHTETHLNMIPAPDGKTVRTHGVIMDVTLRRDIEEALSRYTEDLRRSNHELEQFAYAASHDLQEPLRMINSYLQLIEQRYIDKLDQDGREFIEFAVDGSNRMKTLINDLLTYSRVQRARENFTTFELKRVLDRTLNNLKLTIEDTDSVITCENLPTMTGNEGQMVQLFQNLIGNAIKFRRDSIPPSIHVSATKEKDHWLFAVRDNGIGIDAEYKDRIFVIFQRLHAKGAYPGTGIGLAICKKVVENHGGRIWVDSVPGAGATFYFTIPTSPQRR